MNRQTRSHKKSGLSRKVQKGQQDPSSRTRGYCTTIEAPITKGHNVDSHLERETRGKKPWKGHGDVLGRNRK